MTPGDEGGDRQSPGPGITSTIDEEVRTHAGQRISLTSSWISSCYYNLLDQTLQIEMSGKDYTFFGVPPDVFLGLIEAPSPGQYYATNIKGKYG